MIMNSISTPSSSSASPQSADARPNLQLPTASESSRISGWLPPPRLLPQDTAAAAQSQECKTSSRRKRRTYPGSAEALSMLTLRPVFATPVPRHHVKPRAADGTLVVHDRATNEQFVVYSPLNNRLDNARICRVASWFRVEERTNRRGRSRTHFIEGTVMSPKRTVEIIPVSEPERRDGIVGSEPRSQTQVRGRRPLSSTASAPSCRGSSTGRLRAGNG
jgi:hypothetical protein